MEFKEFLHRYVEEQMKRHHDIGRWQTFENALDYCGGEYCIKEVYYLAMQVSPEAQKRIIGFTL